MSGIKAADAKNIKFVDNRKVGAFFFVIAAVIIGINVFLRIYDSNKSAEFKHVDGVVTSINTKRTYYTGKYHYETTVSVKYSPEGTGLNNFASYGGFTSSFTKKGDVYRVYYKESSPLEAYVAEKDWLTGGYVHAGRGYNVPLVIVAFILVIGFAFFADGVEIAKKGIDPATRLEVAPNGELYDPNLHELARMMSVKRHYNKISIVVAISGFFFTVATASVIAYIIPPDHDIKQLETAAIMFILGSLIAPLYIIFMLRERRRRRRFIAGFMADDATAVYKDRNKAAQILWKHVNRYMYRELPWSRFSYEYSKYWLEKYKNKLEHLKEGKTEMPENIEPPKKIKLGDIVTVTVDRPLGSYHPEHKDMYYPVNYGYVKGVPAPDGEDQDAYILGITEPVQEFTGEVIGIVHREDDEETKLIVTREGMQPNPEQVRNWINFTEKYYRSHIVMKLYNTAVDAEEVYKLGFEMRHDRTRYFLFMDRTPSKEQIRGLLNLLTIKDQLTFWNYYHRCSPDPGSYITVHVVDGKAMLQESNHGWNSSYKRVDMDVLVEFIIRNWNKCYHLNMEYLNAIELSDAFVLEEHVRRTYEEAKDVFVPDYTQPPTFD